MGEFYSELKGWQGAIGSALGFVALLTGALWNYHLNRRRDAELRSQEAQSIAAALYGEIIHIRKAVALLARRYARRYNDLGIGRTRPEVDSHFVEELKLPEPILFRALAAKVGLLPASTISALVQFYSDAYEAERYLARMIPDETRGYTYDPRHVLTPAISAVEGVVPKLRSLELLLSLPKADLDLDLGAAHDVVEMQTDE